MSPTDYQTDGVAQPPQDLAVSRRRRPARKSGAVTPNVPPTTPPPRGNRGGAVSSRGHLKGLSCLTRKCHEQFSGEGTMATSSPYPTGGKGPSHRYLACCLSYYNLKEPLPDHSSLTRIRTRYGVEVFRRFFETVVDQCQQAGLVWGKELYADATKVQANAAVSSLKPRFAVEAHLENLFASGRTQAQIDDLDELQGAGSPPVLSPLASPEQTSLAETSPGEGHVEPVEQEEPPVPRQLHPSLDVALHEALTKVNSARHDWIERVGEPNREITRGNYQRMADFQVSTTDPDATLMQGKGGGSHLGYHTHYIVDGGKARIILAALVTPKARDGKSADARSPLADTFSVEVASTPIYRRHDLWDRREYRRTGRAADSRVCAFAR